MKRNNKVLPEFCTNVPAMGLAHKIFIFWTDFSDGPFYNPTLEAEAMVEVFIDGPSRAM